MVAWYRVCRTSVEASWRIAWRISEERAFEKREGGDIQTRRNCFGVLDSIRQILPRKERWRNNWICAL